MIQGNKGNIPKDYVNQFREEYNQNKKVFLIKPRH